MLKFAHKKSDTLFIHISVAKLYVFKKGFVCVFIKPHLLSVSYLFFILSAVSQLDGYKSENLNCYIYQFLINFYIIQL